MDRGLIKNKFGKMGARIKLGAGIGLEENRWFSPDARNLRIDVRSDMRGEYFDVRHAEDAICLDIIDLRPETRHLLLLSRERASGRKVKFLCGHDERHWFVAAVPNIRGVSNVRTALEALKPMEVLEAQDRKKVKFKHRGRRHTAAYVRQGEWFFLPEPDLNPPRDHVLHDEPLQRGRGKPHMVDHIYRKGGEAVYVCAIYPNGLTYSRYKDLIERDPKARNWYWRMRLRDATVFAKGRVRHADHRTIGLTCWHRVVANAETTAPGMGNVAFLD